MPSLQSSDDSRWDRLIHLVAGELPAEEAAALRSWVDEDPERQQMLARLEQAWRATALPEDARPGAWDAEAELRRIRLETGGAGRVIARVGPSFALSHHPQRRSRVGLALRVAAAAALMVGGGVLWRMQSTTGLVSAPAIATKEYRTAPGERLSFGLPDGTRVMLAPGSVLRRPGAYGIHDRAVYLSGEAYFHVTHDSAHPFAVRTARAVVRDLGTGFVVRAYPDEAVTDVVVSEGLVVVSPAEPPLSGKRNSADTVLLRPHERASLTPDGALTAAKVRSLDPYLGWTSGQLVFERAPLPDVVRRLERWYGIEIRIADAGLWGARLTATFREEGAAEALDVVAASLELGVSRVGRAYVLDRARR